MTLIAGILLLTLMFGSAAWSSVGGDLMKKRRQMNVRVYMTVLTIVVFAIHIIAAASYRGYEFDMNCFSGWAESAFENGLSKFYISDGFHDYPPGYIYILYVLGALKHLFALDGAVWWVVLKLPSIVADIAVGFLAYKVSHEKFGEKAGCVAATFAMLNPTVIFNTCIWGQVDSVLAFLAMLSVFLLSEKKTVPAIFVFAAAVLIKPQAVFFAPLILFGIAEETFTADGFDKKKFVKIVCWSITAVLCMFVMFMSFGANPAEGIKIIIAQYIETVSQYKYMTVNAFNIYGLLGANWMDLTGAVSAVSYIMMAGVVLFSGYVFFKLKGKEKYYITAFILVFGIFMVAPKMHERYAFPAIFALIMVFASVPSQKHFAYYGLFSMAQFFNIAWVLLVYSQDSGYYYRSPSVCMGSFINLAIFVWTMIGFSKVPAEAKNTKKTVKTTVKTEKKRTSGGFALSEKAMKIGAFDIAVMVIVTAVYGCTAFCKLGDKYAPQTETEFCGNSVTVDLGEEHEISNTAFYLGARNLESDRNLKFEYLDESGAVVKSDERDSANVFVWTMSEDINVSARYVTISSNCTDNPSDPSDRLYVREVCFLDRDGNTITPSNIDEAGVDTLFDEQDYLSNKSYMSGTYFDEIYHPRTAYEFLNGMSVYEWTHPPLGKILIGIGISIFGMVPFGWRFVGVLFGIFMVPIVYLFAKRCFGNRWFAALACVMFTFDFMHFTQTRLATIDTYVTFFIMLMYYFMYKYYKMSFYDTPLSKTFVPLGLSGVCFGLSVASKWTGIYAGAGLAVIFFMTLFSRYREYRYALLSPNGETDGISHKTVTETFSPNAIKTIIFCCVMFVVVPFAIYALSYIPYMNTPSGNGFATIFENARSMLTYHGKTVVSETHPYSSYWFEWPVIYRPIWYFSNTLDNGLRQGISAMGNPAVWWVGIPAAAYCTARAILIPLKNKNYFGKNKNIFTAVYAAVFAVLCFVAGVSSADNDSLVRLMPCMLLYSAVFVGVFALCTAFDCKLEGKSARTPIFLIIGYFANYMPWMLVLRTTYIYHYFPCVIFVVLMIVYSIKELYGDTVHKKTFAAGTAVYALLTVGLFVLFYPVLSGSPVSLEFAQNWLKWFSSWVLVA